MPSSNDTLVKKDPELDAFRAALEPKDRLIHDLAAKMLKTRYDPKRSNAYLAYLRSQKEKEQVKEVAKEKVKAPLAA